MNNKLTKCNFCKYFTQKSCMVNPSPYYCREALEEYYRYLKKNTQTTTIKSFRKWDK